MDEHCLENIFIKVLIINFNLANAILLRMVLIGTLPSWYHIGSFPIKNQHYNNIINIGSQLNTGQSLRISQSNN
jgi:hypothetical protein